ncbi:Inner membrane component of T3SS domain-containing protein [Alkalispirochaeta americana]|uniref:Inner membrane component of T3SS domain-containing protein n=1 Tax=Alkalispirochaeta americana TaxID=159291 RepID=A0A1N6NL85_9SPIO|nr:FHA domain-containing protein [Alkalispirochaeta americana]SIP92811.1 Inner membrane component of T3SS domain-containing protein [Alkalispirochaeta americana]
MSLLIRRLIYLAMGVLAGVALWPLVELMLLLQRFFPAYLVFSIASGLLFGAVMGAFFGMIDGIVAARLRRIMTGAGLGGAIGAVGGALGFVLGQGVLFFLSDPGRGGLIVSRLAGWSLLGVCVGASEGIRRRSWLRTGMGVSGGILGGLLGGIALEFLARPLGFVLYGFLVAGFYSLIEGRQSRGVFRLLNGQNKGKEFILNQRRLGIGSWSGSDILLQGYSGTAPRHAELRQKGGDLYLKALVPPEEGTTKRNDRPLDQETSPVLLKFDDVLQIGSAKFLFRPLAMVLVVLATLAMPQEGAAWNLRLGQVNTSRLLGRQTVDLYLGITDHEGSPLEGVALEDLRVLESADGKNFTARPLLSLEERAGEREGIRVLLLVDNSGSMYPARMPGVKAAVRQFLQDLDPSRDRVGLATFNTHYQLLTAPTESFATVELLLETISRPKPDEAFTELYRAISLAAEDLAGVEGRRAVLILTDGENYPFAVHRGDPHPLYGMETVSAGEARDALLRRGVGAFGINFAGGTDPLFEEIVLPNGGVIFDAADGIELGQVYGEIRRGMLQEYRLRYRAGTIPSQKRYLRIEVDAPEGTVSREGAYFAGTLFGLPREDWSPLTLLLFPGALAAAALLGRLRFLNRRKSPNLEILGLRGGATRVLDLSGQETVIGASADADLTMTSSPDMRDRHATIVRDEKRGISTVVSAQEILVNNQRTTRRVLEPGDVIQLPGATLVFDDPREGRGDEGKKGGGPEAAPKKPST